ncbi:MAG TPA: hypothetical protein VF599_12490 [Pyrinomonadaceae bacterium]|jgi:hypothetical protein
MTQIVFIHDLVNQQTGKTFKEEKLEINHSIPLGSLVEVNHQDEEDDDVGVRLYVVGHVRDCDGTPLYRLGMKGAPLRDDWQQEGFYSRKTFGNYGEDSLTVIK